MTRIGRRGRSNPELEDSASDGAVTAAATGDDAKTSEVIAQIVLNRHHRSQMTLASGHPGVVGHEPSAGCGRRPCCLADAPTTMAGIVASINAAEKSPQQFAHGSPCDRFHTPGPVIRITQSDGRSEKRQSSRRGPPH